MIKENWHTHTARCGHAIGTDEEYVQHAIAAGIRTLGFSDHAPYPALMPHERMNLEQLPDYIQAVQGLKERYSQKIKLHLGMEVEYYPPVWDYLRQYRKQMDYCLLGQHYLDYEATESSYHLHTPEQLVRYTDLIEEACRHGLCDYVAHPDLCLWDYPGYDDTVRSIAARLADISLRYDMPMELNCGHGVRIPKKSYSDGLRYPYPTRLFLEEFARKKCLVIIGLDIHDPKQFDSDVLLDRALSVAEGLDIRFADDYDILEAAAKRKKEFY